MISVVFKTYTIHLRCLALEGGVNANEFIHLLFIQCHFLTEAFFV